jgi:hypothetical protein
MGGVISESSPNTLKTPSLAIADRSRRPTKQQETNFWGREKGSGVFWMGQRNRRWQAYSPLIPTTAFNPAVGSGSGVGLSILIQSLARSENR